MKLLLNVTLVVSFSLSAQVYKNLSPTLLQHLDDIMEDIYRIDAEELLEIVGQDVGPIVHIAAENLRQLMALNPNLLVINVLSEHWYQDCHIAGSINVPLKELVYTMQDWDRNQSIVVYCALDACDAGQKAYILLRCMGFPFVLDYQGGIKEWFQLGYVINGPCAASYLHESVERTYTCLELEE